MGECSLHPIQSGVVFKILLGVKIIDDGVFDIRDKISELKHRAK